jgi:hypothetical protein
MNITMKEREYLGNYQTKGGENIDLKVYDHVSTTCLRKYMNYLCILSGLNVDIMNIILKKLYQLENEQYRDWIICYYYEPQKVPISYIRKCYNIPHNVFEISKYELCEYYNMYDYNRIKVDNVPFWTLQQWIHCMGILNGNDGKRRTIIYVHIYQPGEGPY